MAAYKCEDCDIQLKFIGVTTINQWKYQCPKCYKIVIKRKFCEENMKYLLKRSK